MKLLALKEITKNEKRVSITPDIVDKYISLGIEVLIEESAGKNIGIDDQIYKNKGAKIIKDINKIIPQIDILIAVQNTNIDLSKAKENLIFIALFNPSFQIDIIKKLKNDKVKAFAMELLPRITRAQSMDVLSSQSNLAGYRAVIDAVYEMQKAVPMLMTAAGTISAAKFMILGAGVAGLQAIATAKRLGGIVCAFDVRTSAKEQVESLGAKFIEVKSDEKIDGVYAKEMSEEYKKQQQELLAKTIEKQDIVITTALIPGKKAPILITKEMVKSMTAGSIIIDLAAVNGGNCEFTKVDEIVESNGVKIIGYSNYPSRIAEDCSKLYARNIFNFIDFLIDKKSNKIVIDYEDEIVKSSLISN